MPYFLGIDTSNYTTSVALYNSDTNRVLQKKQLLPVKTGQLGLRQSDAVFLHTKQLPILMTELLHSPVKISAVGVSTKPRQVQGSYMPCFLAGVSVAQSVAAALNVPYFSFSHQCGHIMAALYSSDALDLADKPFIAFHISGGTTEAVYVTPHPDGGFSAKIIAESTDLKMGQAVDRIGAMLQLPFPAGVELNKLAEAGEWLKKIPVRLQGKNCSVSGLQNKCQAMLEGGETAQNIARYTFEYLSVVLDKMTEQLLKEYPGLPLVFSGGVMSNTIIKKHIQTKYGAYFAEPVFSSDNAAGIAILTAKTYERD